MRFLVFLGIYGPTAKPQGGAPVEIVNGLYFCSFIYLPFAHFVRRRTACLIFSGSTKRKLTYLTTELREQERPQDFGWGVNAPLPPEAKKILKI